MSVWSFFLTDSPTLIIIAFARYNDVPLTKNATTMSKGIKIIKDWSFSINNFLIAGSKSQAIDEVLPATKIEKKAERKILFKNLKIEEFKKFHPEFDEDVFVDLKPFNVVKSRNSEGGSGFVQVEKEVNNWQKRLLL